MTVPPHLPWAKKYPDSVDWSAALPARPLYEILDDAVRAYPDNIFIDFLGKTYSYRATAYYVARAAKGLQALGIVKGDRVGLLLPNTPNYVFLYFAALKIGATIVNFNPLYTASDIEKQVKDSGCRVMATIDMPDIYGKLLPVVGKGRLEKIIVCRMQDILPLPLSVLYPYVKRRDIVRVRDNAQNIDFRHLVANDGTFTPVLIDPATDIAVLQYTGGTTGVPKGAMLSHANLSANALQSRLMYSKAIPGQEVMLGVLPFFHVFAMTVVMNFTILLGGRIIMLPRFELAQVVKTIDKKRPTLFPAVPTIYTAINHYQHIGRFDLRSIRFCISGGAPLPEEVRNDFIRLTGCALVEGYGLSETSPVATCNPPDGENKANSIGIPVPGTTIEIVSLEDKKTVLAQGETGEVCIRGPQVMLGYWHSVEETANVFDETPEGVRLHTGDVGYLDEDGYTLIVDRIKDMIAAGGFKIYPRKVEEVIYQHPSVEECIVAGVPDTYRGQTVKAFIKLREGQHVTAEEMKIFLHDKLSPIDRPRLIEFRDSLPKTLIGKLSRKMVLEEDAKRS
jgi:long-chain acyl-CoA synthetase